MRLLMTASAGLVLALTALTACTSATDGRGDGGPSATPTSSAASSAPSSHASSRPSSASTSSPTKSPTTTPPPPSRAAQVLASLDEAQRVGQLLMVDCPSTEAASATIEAITGQHVGGVILDGNSSLSVSQTRAVTGALQSHAPSGLGLLISTDQEGGLVRRLRGPGFSDIPSAVAQGQQSPSTLRAQATTWGGQLHAAGVNVDLAPVMDTVPADSPGNPPIGDLDREYGHDPGTVASHGTAVAEGLAAAGVAATIKHFPGLGRVTGNTDTTSGVTDTVTTRHDTYLQPFATAIRAGAPFVMMSTAIYSRLDPNTPAAFSSTIIGTILRGDLGFTGVIISDDLGNAAQVSGYSVGSRAVDFVQAGGDVVLTVNATQAATMTAALLSRANSDPAFKAKVDAAALVVLQEKQRLGLL
ncbi:glycoside hydrolase family 3 N-terminal domain-containing protein [Jatrophihabitans sp.]|uniref:glycoside hydrolase family 3 N-terminal domain-containing protein n=1 Tax=Jatrophihabitans sp. TaxID=1932789 RepID=UPI0030C6E16E|nr:Beta-N-acetylhexosaminidase [Jatrophihabitans sp.]